MTPLRLGPLTDALAELQLVPSRASAGASERIAAVIDDQFERGVDPYGEPWEPLSPLTRALRPWRHDPALTDTRKLRDGIRVAPLQSGGVGITFSVDYAVHHQFGAPNNRFLNPSGGEAEIPRRAIVPEEAIGFSESWSNAIKESVEEAFAKATRKR